MLGLTLDPRTREVLVWLVFIAGVVLLVNAITGNRRDRWFPKFPYSIGPNTSLLVLVPVGVMEIRLLTAKPMSHHLIEKNEIHSHDD